MKTYILRLFLVTTIAFGAISCKNNESKEDTRTADDVANTEQAVDFTIDTEASVINWIGSKPTGTHNGAISLSKGKLSLLEDKVVAGEFIIDIASITVLDLEGDDKVSLEGHLKGLTEEGKDHFFNVAEFPTAGFKITGTSTEDEQLFLIGDLTIKDVTNQVSFPITLNITDEVVSIASESFTIDRSKYNIKYGSKSFFADLGDNFISDEIQLEFKISTIAK